MVVGWGGGINDILKGWIFKRGLRSDCMFWKKLDLKEAHNLKYLLGRTQLYINNEEKLLEI